MSELTGFNTDPRNPMDQLYHGHDAVCELCDRRLFSDESNWGWQERGEAQVPVCHSCNDEEYVQEWLDHQIESGTGGNGYERDVSRLVGYLLGIDGIPEALKAHLADEIRDHYVGDES